MNLKNDNIQRDLVSAILALREVVQGFEMHDEAAEEKRLDILVQSRAALERAGVYLESKESI